MKQLLAGGAMALAIGSTSVMITSPAFAADEAKPAATAPAAATAAAAAPAAPAAVPNKADTAWLLQCFGRYTAIALHSLKEVHSLEVSIDCSWQV